MALLGEDIVPTVIHMMKTWPESSEQGVMLVVSLWLAKQVVTRSMLRLREGIEQGLLPATLGLVSKTSDDTSVASV